MMRRVRLGLTGPEVAAIGFGAWGLSGGTSRWSSNCMFLAAEKEAAPGQIALAWLLRQGVVPIPGTRGMTHLENNVRALGVELSADDLARLDEIFAPGAVAGERYPSPGALIAEGAASA